MSRIKMLAATAGIAGLTFAGLAAASAANANVAGSRATNANVNPVAGYIAVPENPTMTVDHWEAYLGAQQHIADLQPGNLANAFGGGLCQANAGGSTSAAAEIGIIQVASGVYQVAFATAEIGPAKSGAVTSGDNCEDGPAGNFITGTPTADPSLCPNTDSISGVYARSGGGTPLLICTLGTTFSFGNVEEAEVQYLPHRGALFSERQITSDNPGPWFYSSGGTPVFNTGYESFLGGPSTMLNEGVIGADANTSSLTGPATVSFAPWAHAGMSAQVGSHHKSYTAFFDNSSNWTAVPVTSFPNGNTADQAVLAPNGMRKGNGGLNEGTAGS